MPIDYDLIKNWEFPEIEHTYTEKDTIIYALSLGIGHDPLDTKQLQYIYEKELKAFPTMAVILGYPGLWMTNPKAKINFLKVVHGEQRLTILKPLPKSGTIKAQSRVSHVIDKGVDKGALVIVERSIFDENGTLLAVTEQTTFCRADGGFGQGDESPSALPKPPASSPDAIEEIEIRPDAAVLYRLNADPNPLHIDPEIAKAAGFDKPILHGLCTYGLAAHALVKNYCDYQAEHLLRFDTRFSSPVFPGETLVVEMWQLNDEEISFQAKVKERDIVVLSNGIAKIKK
ncbi:MAG TPA: MaoC/PaaZ C-terminal domain-containing protein [Oligella sp.]|nr:MaoC/PaaZ C-terminal domain-containing protein [Oligella sp.]